MASAAAGGPLGGLSAVEVVVDKVAGSEAVGIDVVVGNVAELGGPASVDAEDVDGAGGDVAPGGPKKKAKGKGKAGKGKAGTSLIADDGGAVDDGAGATVGEKPAKGPNGRGKGKPNTAAAMKRPAAYAKGGAAKMAKRPVAQVEADATQATQSDLPPPDDGVVAPGANTTGPAPTPSGCASTAIVPHGATVATPGNPKYRDTMKARRFQQLWAQKALPAECMHLIDEATAAKARGDSVYYQSGYFLEPPGFYLV